MTCNEAFQVSDDVVAREVAGEMVLLDLASGVYFGLDPVGSHVWNKLSEGPITLADLTDIIEAKFDAPYEVINKDIAALLEQLTEKGLVGLVTA